MQANENQKAKRLHITVAKIMPMHFLVHTHSLFYRPGIVGTGVCAWFRMGKDKVSDFGEGGDCSGKVENGM